jgi:hypothetical protein
MLLERIMAPHLTALLGIALLLSSCAVPSRPIRQSQQAIAGDDTGAPNQSELVAAIVERLEAKAHQDSLEDGSVVVSDVVAFAIVAPRRFDKLLFASTHGHPRVGDRPLLLGDRVRFILPAHWESRELTLEDLHQLEFAP